MKLSSGFHLTHGHPASMTVKLWTSVQFEVDSKTEKIEPALQAIFKELEQNVYTDGYTWDKDLKRWSNQGVLLLNASLTTGLTNLDNHDLIWKPFMEFLFDTLNIHYPGLIYVFLGKKMEHAWLDHMNDNSYKLTCSHPNITVYHNTEWHAHDIFNEINKILKANNNTEIKW
jgi:uracil-DNA glycosylase